MTMSRPVPKNLPYASFACTTSNVSASITAAGCADTSPVTLNHCRARASAPFAEGNDAMSLLGPFGRCSFARWGCGAEPLGFVQHDVGHDLERALEVGPVELVGHE